MIDLDKKCTIEKCWICEKSCLYYPPNDKEDFVLAKPDLIDLRLNIAPYIKPSAKALMCDVLKRYADDMIIEKEKEKNMETKTYEQGLEEAWEIARKIAINSSDGGYMEKEVKAICGKRWYDVFTYMSIYEVKAKIDAWGAEKNKPKLGDVVEGVELKSGAEVIGIYLGINTFKGSDFYTVFEPSFEEPTFLMLNEWTIKKTGKHFDIQGMLDEIKGDV